MRALGANMAHCLYNMMSESMEEKLEHTIPRYRVTVAYDGTDFKGWQKQPGLRTVQETIEDAVRRLAPEGAEVVIHGSGRTDAGVHAFGQVAHFDLERDMPCFQLRKALNRWLPYDVRILDVERVDNNFHARRTAHSKEYRYRIYNDEVMHPMHMRTCAHVSKPLNIEKMKQAASILIGEHDFAAFTANPNREVETTVRHVYSIDFVEEGPILELRFTGNGFLYKMVRSLSGVLISVGEGKFEPDFVQVIMDSKERTAIVETAPARGLSLYKVNY